MPGASTPTWPRFTWKSCEARGPDQRDRQADDLDVGGEVALAQQLGAHLQHLARSAAALGLLAVHRARVAEPERPVGAARTWSRQRGRGWR